MSEVDLTPGDEKRVNLVDTRDVFRQQGDYILTQGSLVSFDRGFQRSGLCITRFSS